MLKSHDHDSVSFHKNVLKRFMCHHGHSQILLSKAKMMKSSNLILPGMMKI